MLDLGLVFQRGVGSRVIAVDHLLQTALVNVLDVLHDRPRLHHSEPLFKPYALQDEEQIVPVPLHGDDLQRKNRYEIDYEVALEVDPRNLVKLAHWPRLPFRQLLDEKLEYHIDEEEAFESSVDVHDDFVVS